MAYSPADNVVRTDFYTLLCTGPSLSAQDFRPSSVINI